MIEKPYLDNWRHRVGREDADKVLRNAAEFGTKLHGAAQKVAWRARGGVSTPPEDREAPLLEGHHQDQDQEGTLEVSYQTGPAQIGEASGAGQARGGKGYRAGELHQG